MPSTPLTQPLSRRAGRHLWVLLVVVATVTALLTAVLQPVLAGAATAAPAGALTSGTPRGAVVDPDRNAVELGMRFVPKVAGTVTGVRVFKASGERLATPASGTLWDRRGHALATAKFDRTGGTGWRSVEFTTPVTLRAGETYTVSVFAPDGRYAVTENGFAAAKTTEFLTAPGGSNGVYTYGRRSAFPTKTYESSNYWVDVLFVPAASGPIKTPAPEPTPVPEPEPTSGPAPQPTPAPEPEPTTDPAPQPTPAPEP
ncbi:DUF4082 domain-containing protein, partial [Georgenia yuyongxinii]